VTLQKEQGLITKSAPSDAAIRVAMGYGCPDTAPCASQFFGLYNQLYKAAWQFKRYSTPDPWGGIQPGVENLRYHPNAACGTKKVTVLNNATAALYNYTPYTPNAAALANLHGTGDSCSAYGNRNFWVYYTQWFGSTLAGIGDEMVGAAYAKAGGSTGALGAETTPKTCGGSATCVKTYRHGVVYWTSPTGAIVVSGAIGDSYLLNGGIAGVLGIPAGPATAISSITNGNGQIQKFAGGVIASSAGGAFATTGTVLSAHSLSGGATGSLGWPTGAKVCGLPSGGCSQAFQGGTIYAPAVGTAVAVPRGEIARIYAAQGGAAGVLGYPTAPASSIVSATNGNGQIQSFRGGSIRVSGSGSFAEFGSILAAHSSAGGVTGVVGWPTSDRTCTLPGGGCVQSFQGGKVYAPSTGPAFFVQAGVLANFYADNGGPAGLLGYPVASAVAVVSKANGNGLHQKFAGGVAHSGPAGVFIESGSILEAHTLAGGAQGVLGWPTGAIACNLPAGGCSQNFQHGVIYGRSTGAAIPVLAGSIATVYDALGGVSGVLGYPTSSQNRISGAKNGTGTNQRFVGGYIQKSKFGTFAESGVIMRKHIAAGWVTGKYGWPVAAAVCGLPDGGCSQKFQHGTLFTNR
jgi:uncharacterized protein with LGFP repeats